MNGPAKPLLVEHASTRVNETVIRVSGGAFVARLWLEGHDEQWHGQIERDVRSLLTMTALDERASAVASALAGQHAGINAVEVFRLDESRGAIVYPRWP